MKPYPGTGVRGQFLLASICVYTDRFKWSHPPHVVKSSVEPFLMKLRELPVLSKSPCLKGEWLVPASYSQILRAIHSENAAFHLVFTSNHIISAIHCEIEETTFFSADSSCGSRRMHHHHLLAINAQSLRA